ncbi:MAG: carboxypeptidase regulatory-like domain-containing protein, partial [Treponema sp.]|nr:carboxypeptidase regulatory-like domain-containing protein [Treponema sp.]
MKRLTWLAAALTAVVLSFVGCPNPVSDATDPSGVFGRVVGVVYDEVSGLPIKDAKVAIDGYGVISTNENGTYIFEDVIPGNYLITVSAPGYSAYSVRTNVNAERYLEDDPFMEADNLRKQIDLFSEWVAAYQAANGSDAYPAYGEGTTGYLGSNTDNSWYYQDGVYVSEDGSVSISSTGTDPAFPTFQVTYNRLDDYTYRYGIDAGVIRLKPRSGGFEGKIEVAFEVHNSVVQVTDTKPAKGVSVYFIDAAANGVTISDTWNGSTDKTADRVYGPFYTDDNGYFKASELPAKTDFFVVISPFSQTKDGIDYYFNPQVAYTPGDWANPIVIGTTATDHDNDTATPDIDPTPFSTATGNKVTVGEQEYDEEWNPLPIEITEEGFVNIGKLVFFTVGNVAYVTGGNVPNAHSPLAVTDAITLKFNREIAVGELVATLTFESGNAVVYGDSNSSDPNEQPETEQILSVVGSRSVSDGFEVSLEPKAKLKEYSKISLAYSVDEGKPLAKLKVDGKAKDGSQIYQAGAIPVYTREGLKLVQYEYLSAAVAASQRSNTVKTEVGGAIKLIFNKPLSKTYSGTTFTINGHPADYRFDPTNPNAVVVFTDWEVSEAATVNFTVVSEADTGDALYNETFDASLTVGAGIQLILKSTNLYTNAQGVAFGPDAAADAIFPVDGKIVFTFVDIPEGAKASVELKNGSEIVPLDKPPEVSSTAETLTITPSRIEVGGTYTIKVKITDANDVTLWTPKNGTLVNVGLPSEDPAPPNPDEGLIKFKSSDLNTLSLLKTNLYTDYNGIARTPSDSVKIFPVDKSIEFTFNNLDGVIVAAELEKVVSSPGTNVSVYTGTPVVAGNTVTITPARLEPGQKYTLVLRIAGEDGLILWGVPTLYDNATPPQPKAGQAGPIYVTASNKIEFTTSEDLQLALLSTNLYTDPTETNLGQEKIVQPSTSNGG